MDIEAFEMWNKYKIKELQNNSKDVKWHQIVDKLFKYFLKKELKG